MDSDKGTFLYQKFILLTVEKNMLIRQLIFGENLKGIYLLVVKLESICRSLFMCLLANALREITENIEDCCCVAKSIQGIKREL